MSHVVISPRRAVGRPAFTVVELMAVVAIAAVLVGVMLPAIAKARETARLTQCASNLRQIALGLTAYASQNRGRYPPNTSTLSPGEYWYDDERVGAYLPATRPPVPLNKPGGPVYTCPNDGPGTVFLSYAMNVWASCIVDPNVRGQAPRWGRLWSAGVKEPSRMLLAAEAFSGQAIGRGWGAAPTVGQYCGTNPTPTTLSVTVAGRRFGGGTGALASVGRFYKVKSELAYFHHRNPGWATVAIVPQGRLNIAYADGHVAARTDADLVRPDGTATGDTCWSPADLPGD